MSELVMKYGVVPPYVCQGCREYLGGKLLPPGEHRCDGDDCQCPNCRNAVETLRKMLDPRAAEHEREVAQLKARIAMLEAARASLPVQMTTWRGIEDLADVCPSCSGSGVKMYGDSSTWRRRPAGQVCTRDVCDVCWGSGSRKKAWPSWKRFDMTYQVAKDLVGKLRAGSKLSALQKVGERLAKALGL